MTNEAIATETQTTETRRRAIWLKKPDDGHWSRHTEDFDTEAMAAQKAREDFISWLPDGHYKLGKTVLILPLGADPNLNPPNGSA